MATFIAADQIQGNHGGQNHVYEPVTRSKGMEMPNMETTCNIVTF